MQLSKLFLCEKPSQGKEIAKALNILSGRKDGYFEKNGVAVTWGFGHLIAYAMPAEYGEEYANFGDIESLPIIPKKWIYVSNKDSKKQLGIIKKLLSYVNEVVIATDADREGEVIGREILDYFQYEKKVSRLWAQALDEESLKKALANIEQGAKREALYMAGLARSRADWLIGMNLSRAYTIAYGQGYGKEGLLSIGRVQTATLALVVDRDRHHHSFKSITHYGVKIKFQTNNGEVFDAVWQIPDSLKNENGLFVNEQLARQVIQNISNGTIESVHKERKKAAPPLPFSLSKLNTLAGKKLKLSVTATLKIAQRLYETKIISYPRTPCEYLPFTQKAEVPRVLAALTFIDPSICELVKKADPVKETKAWNDNQVKKHSHHAIIPTTEKNQAPQDFLKLSKNEKEIYDWIRKRYIAQFYPDYEYDVTTIIIKANGYFFKAVANEPIKQGWREVLGDEEKSENPEISLPLLKSKDVVSKVNGTLDIKKTKPLPLFTEATLATEMETLSEFLKSVDDENLKKVLKTTQGIGTVATRGAIIDILIERQYIEKTKGKIVSTNKGQTLIDNVPKVISDPITTAKWEIALAGIEAGKLTLEQFMTHQIALLEQLVKQAKTDAAKRPGRKNTTTGTENNNKKKIGTGQPGQECPTCGTGELVARSLKDAPDKKYLGCKAFPTCKHFEWV